MSENLHKVGQHCLNFEANKAVQVAFTFDDAEKLALGELQLSSLTLNEQQQVILELDRL